jgi:putative transposase
MARKRFNAEQIVAILREAERGVALADLVRTHGISEQTFYRWKRMYGGMEGSDVKKAKQLEEENAKLKRLVGEQALVIQSQQEFMKKRGWL